MATENDEQQVEEGAPAPSPPDQPTTKSNDHYVPTDEDRRALEAFEAELFKREVANAKAYDKAILMYSTGALGLSLTFIKDILPPGNAVYLDTLDASWIAFLAALVGMLASYLVGQFAIRRQRDLAYEVFLENKQEKLKPTYNRWAAGVDYLNFSSGMCFVLGAALMTWFVANNVERREAPSTAHSAVQDAPVGHGTTIVANDAPVILMQQPSASSLSTIESKPRIQPPQPPCSKPSAISTNAHQPKGGSQKCPANH